MIFMSHYLQYYDLWVTGQKKWTSQFSNKLIAIEKKKLIAILAQLSGKYLSTISLIFA